MSATRIIGIGGLAALLCAGSAIAEEQHPPYRPTRDVAVTYTLDHEGPGAPKQAHLYYSAASGKLRFEDQKQVFVLDWPGKTTTVVMLREHIYLQTPFDPETAMGFLLNGDMKFARGNSETIAGQRCTDWTVDTAVATGSVCVTDDGVLLRSRGQSKNGGGGGGFQATEVSYDAQPATLFIPPAGFRKVDVSELGGRLPR